MDKVDLHYLTPARSLSLDLRIKGVADGHDVLLFLPNRFTSWARGLRAFHSGPKIVLLGSAIKLEECLSRLPFFICCLACH